MVEPPNKSGQSNSDPENKVATGVANLHAWPELPLIIIELTLGKNAAIAHLTLEVDSWSGSADI
ncbi:hypothetical protein [Laspinema olomoucense]|uniref:hypothetical protein n=1 Tax=Laspinema olomoucense TaxID=3231600 RepID=UPI0021BA4057|nr:hypothetical protein [Laspinema sp. D3a]MCT7986841.1 hypothetical protein [Laspinema sp. D3a]